MKAILIAAAIMLAANAGPPASAAPAQTFTARFDEAVAVTKWSVADLGLPADWSGYGYLVFDMRATSSQRFELGLDGPDGFVSKRIHPRPNVWVRASVPLAFFRSGLGDGVDLAATVNKPHDSYWINIEAGGHGPVTHVTSLSVTARYPVGHPTLELRNVHLETADPGDAILDGKPIIDRFGQYARADWPGKALSETQLRADWDAEAAALKTAPAPVKTTIYGGFADRRVKATGFFRVEKIEGKWWFVDPQGALFWSTGVNGTGPGPGTPVKGREFLFEQVPADESRPNSFHGANLKLRYGQDWPGKGQAAWAADTVRRMKAWGLNTAYGDTLNTANADLKTPYVMTLRGWQSDHSIMGMPDVYAADFPVRVDQLAAQQLDGRKSDPWLLGYFIGNEPPWPGRESQLVDLVLSGPPSALQQHFREGLKAGDTPDVRRQLVLDAFARYLEVINAAVKRHDPNHLNLGIRFGGTPPMYVVRLAKGFDVYSLNKYRWAPPVEMTDAIYKELGLPMLIGEFHMGAPERGLAPGLVQVANQHERGVAYSYYVENAASQPYIVGTHWFEWVDEPASGRMDGENYNIGWVDVTDRPYGELVTAARATHGRVAAIHAGETKPATQRAVTSDTGTPDDTSKLGVPAIQ